jgi:hypothetical protein
MLLKQRQQAGGKHSECELRDLRRAYRKFQRV